MQTILVVEDDTMLNQGLCFNLEMNGYKAYSAGSLGELKDKWTHLEWSLVLLDVNLPDGDGYEAAEWIRRRSQVPLVFLTAYDLDSEVLKGFDAGADDYVTKPFHVQILLKRISAVLMRSGKQSGRSRFICGNLEIDQDSCEVKRSGKTVALTRTEFRLLMKFCQNPGIVLTRQVLLEELWDKDGDFVDEHALTIQVSRLRQKLSDDTFNYIKTVYGLGYQWMNSKGEE